MLLKLNPTRFSFKKLFYSTSSHSTISSGDVRLKRCQSQPLSELGQATHWTHPHLFDAANLVQQVTPGLTYHEFESRRETYIQNLLNYQTMYFSSRLSHEEKLKLRTQSTSDWRSVGFDFSSIDHNFISIIPSSMSTFMAPDVPYTFKQNSDFLYLTGFKEAGSILVISRSDDAKNAYKTALFVRDKNPKTELWEGPVTGPSQITKLTGIQNAYSINEFKTYVHSLIKETRRKVTLWRYPSENLLKHESGPNCINEKIESEIDEIVKENSNKLIDMSEAEPIDNSAAASYFNSSRFFTQYGRVKKSPAEIKIMRAACEISSQSFVKSMQITHPFINEHLVYSKFDYECRLRGSEYLAYIPVVAGGNRATTLHYIKNNQIVKNGELLLVDAGGQYRDYCSDITRTWPVSGKFTQPQRDLYEACLNVQEYCLELCVPGITLQKLYYAMMRKLGEELSGLGLVDKKEHENAVRMCKSPTDPLPMYYVKKLSNFCPHDVGHYLGLDVHDCPEVAKNVELEAGCVITIEPGIYIKENDESVPFKYRGIGIRIEDDVVITDEAKCDVLSKSCPKKIDDIENILKA